MERVAIISVDGHVKAPRAAYRDYIEQKYLDRFDEWLTSLRRHARRLRQRRDRSRTRNGTRSGGSPISKARGWSPRSCSRTVPPFAAGAGRLRPDPDITRQASMAYNRWLVDFCSAAPGRLCGQAMVPFHDVDQAVADIHWVKEQGLVGILMPPLYPGSKFFFDPALDPIWAACQEVGLPLSQHGGTGAPNYQPEGFTAFMVLSVEHSFFSGRSLWQLILGGVFERFPDLKLAFVETEVVVDRAGDGSARHACIDRRRVDGVRPDARWREAVPPPAERVLGDELLRRHLPVHARRRSRSTAWGPCTTSRRRGSASAATTRCSASTTRIRRRSSRR